MDSLLRSISKCWTNTVLMSETTCFFYFLMGGLIQACGVKRPRIAWWPGRSTTAHCSTHHTSPSSVQWPASASVKSLSNFILVHFSKLLIGRRDICDMWSTTIPCHSVNIYSAQSTEFGRPTTYSLMRLKERASWLSEATPKPEHTLNTGKTVIF